MGPHGLFLGPLAGPMGPQVPLGLRGAHGCQGPPGSSRWAHGSPRALEKSKSNYIFRPLRSAPSLCWSKNWSEPAIPWTKKGHLCILDPNLRIHSGRAPVRKPILFLVLFGFGVILDTVVTNIWGSCRMTHMGQPSTSPRDIGQPWADTDIRQSWSDTDMSRPGADTNMIQPRHQLDLNRGRQLDLNRGHQLDLNRGRQLDLNAGHQLDLNRGQQLDLNPGHQFDLNLSWTNKIAL